MVDARRVLYELRSMPPDRLVEPGVTAADALAVMTPGPIAAGVRRVSGQVYGQATRPLTMELFARTDPRRRCPGVVFIHGGGFVEGYPEMLIRYAAQLAGLGYVTASIGYRLAGEALFPAAVEDSKCAVRWLRAHAGELGLDPGRLAAAGNSAGGYLAAMLGSTPGRMEGAGGWQEQPSAVQAVVLWYPPVDLRPSASTPEVRDAVTAFLGHLPTEQEAAAVSPASLVQQAPPTLTLAGTDDPLIPIGQLREYHRSLDAAGVAHRLREFPGVGHSFDYNLERWAECFDELTAWLERHLSD